MSNEIDIEIHTMYTIFIKTNGRGINMLDICIMAGIFEFCGRDMECAASLRGVFRPVPPVWTNDFISEVIKL